MPATPLATPQDVADVWRPLTAAEETQVAALLTKAEAKLRQKAPFDIDARMGLFATDPTDPTALDPVIVADVLATVVKRFMVNRDGVASSSEGTGPFSKSQTFVNRYDKTGSDVRGAIQITESDLDQLRPAVPAAKPEPAIRVNVPCPQVLVPRGRITGRGDIGPAIVPDYYPGSGAE